MRNFVLISSNTNNFISQSFASALICFVDNVGLDLERIGPCFALVCPCYRCTVSFEDG